MTGTTDIITSINEARMVGEKYIKLRKLNNQKNDIENFGLLLKPVYESFQNVEKLYNNLLSTGVISDSINWWGDSKSTLNGLISKFNSDEYDRILLHALKREVTNSESALLKSWKDYIDGRISGINETLHMLKGLIGDMSEAQQLQQKRNIITTAQPGTPESIQVINDYVHIANNLLSKLNLNNNIKSFLNQLMDEQATLGDMNIEVYNWLSSNGFAKKIKVTFDRNILS